MSTPSSNINTTPNIKNYLNALESFSKQYAAVEASKKKLEELWLEVGKIQRQMTVAEVQDLHMLQTSTSSLSSNINITPNIKNYLNALESFLKQYAAVEASKNKLDELWLELGKIQSQMTVAEVQRLHMLQTSIKQQTKDLDDSKKGLGLQNTYNSTKKKFNP